MEHLGEKAGEMGVCEKCAGLFVRPSDPMPGMVALPWDVAPADVEPPTETATKAKESARESESGSPRRTHGSVGKGRRLDRFDTRELLTPLNELGLHGILVAWSPKQPGNLKVGTTSGCPKDEADRKILDLALAWIKARSPQLYAKLLVELARLDPAQRVDDE